MGIMFVCIPSMDRWDDNPIYNKIIKHAKDKSRFLFFVRPYQMENYRNSMPDVSIISIGEECVNIGTTRRWIDNYMRNRGVNVYCQMDDRVCSLGCVYFVDGKANLTDKSYNSKNVDCILDMMDRTARCVIKKYPQTAILSIRRRGFANSVSYENLVDLNSSIAAIDDVLIVNTAYPLENIPETDRFSEDKNFVIAAMAKRLYTGILHLFVRDTDEGFASRCMPDKKKDHTYILNTLGEILQKRYRCEEWMNVEWNTKREFPVFKLNCKKSPVPRIRIGFEEKSRILEETE
jgi:hypothetical protein